MTEFARLADTLAGRIQARADKYMEEMEWSGCPESPREAVKETLEILARELRDIARDEAKPKLTPY